MNIRSNLIKKALSRVFGNFFILPLLGMLTISGVAIGAENVPRTAFVHLFEWRWDDIAKECENFLGPKGFAAVQVSPPNEHRLVKLDGNKGYPWWERYQPVSYKLESRSGNEQQFKDMVSRCKAVGVKIYADTVINHMTGPKSDNDSQFGKGTGGSSYAYYAYPPYPNDSYFHSCHTKINDYNNRGEVQNCNLENLADLNTGSPQVQDTIAAYLNQLMDMGVAGFRIDAAKHINTADIHAILAKVKGKPEVIQEVIESASEPVQAPEYFQNGLVNEFDYGKKVAEFFRGGPLSALQSFGGSWKELMPGDKAVVFVDNHDKQRGHGGGGNYITFKDGKLYDLANVFMLSWPYGYPQLMSSYDFTDSDTGPPSDGDGHTRQIYQGNQPSCFQEWKCEHRWRPIANMVAFRNNTLSAWHVNNWWSNGNNQIAFSRGDKGFVVFNKENSILDSTFQTGMAAGSYCNILAGDFVNGSCNGPIIIVNGNGTAKLSVAPMTAAAIHVGAKLPPAEAVWFFRGTSNDWDKKAMTRIGTTDTYETCQTFSGKPNPRFKIDRFGDWKESYPGSDQTITDGSFQILFNEKSHQITVAANKKCATDAWYIRGTANNWDVTPMDSVDNEDKFCSKVAFTKQNPKPRFKIDHSGDWKESYPTQDMPVSDCATYQICFNHTNKTVDAKKLDDIKTGACGNGKLSLGATYQRDATTFALWSPDAANVQLWLDGKPYPMVRSPDGNGLTDVYAVTVLGDQHLKHYNFRVDGREARDPYAVMADPASSDISVGIVVDLAKTGPTGGWAPQPPLKAREDSVIYEVHIRDFTIDPSSGVAPEKSGKFLGMVQSGTTHQQGKVKTGLDHLKELGVTHVQILPFYDFKACGASKDQSTCYSWGYDPLNYNVPEERYSISKDPLDRIRELKTMINEFHKAGIRVVMDVVYNHTPDKSIFSPITDKYYLGNDISGAGATINVHQQPMVSRFIRDSLEYWIREYHIDGFRFDLMGIFDYAVVGDWGRYLNQQFPDANLLIYGEPWRCCGDDPFDADRVRLGTIGTIVDAHVGGFNDQYRKALKGENKSGTGGGYIFNQLNNLFPIRVGSRGAIRFSYSPSQILPNQWDQMFANDPEQSINYVSAHDDLILRDKILKWTDSVNKNCPSATATNDGYLKRIQEFANGIILTSQGIPFLHAGDEMLRTKNCNPDSVEAPDSVNAIRWNWKVDNAEVVDYYRQAIALRKNHSGFRLTTWDQINSNIETQDTLRNGVLVNRIKAKANGDNWQDIIVIYNSADNYEYTLPPGTWFVAMEKSDPNAGKDRPVSGKIIAEGTAVTVLHQ